MQSFILETNTVIGQANIIINDGDNFMEAGGFDSCHVDIKAQANLQQNINLGNS